MELYLFWNVDTKAKKQPPKMNNIARISVRDIRKIELIKIKIQNLANNCFGGLNQKSPPTIRSKFNSEPIPKITCDILKIDWLILILMRSILWISRTEVPAILLIFGGFIALVSTFQQHYNFCKSSKDLKKLNLLIKLSAWLTYLEFFET